MHSLLAGGAGPTGIGGMLTMYVFAQGTPNPQACPPLRLTLYIRLSRRIEMPTENGSNAERRVPLSRERVLRAAVALADQSGIESLTMRRLGQELRVKAVSYTH